MLTVESYQLLQEAYYNKIFLIFLVGLKWRKEKPFSQIISKKFPLIVLVKFEV